MAPDLDCSSPTDEMKGYLRKSKKWNKRFFVLREGPPPRLEYYDSEKKCSLKSKPKRIIELENAWNIDKKTTSKHKFLIGVFTEEEYFAMSADCLATQEMWVNALQKAVLGSKGPAKRSHCMYRHIWQGNVDTKDLQSCNNNLRISLQGFHRCCLTEKTMVFIRVNHAGAADLQRNHHVEINIASIRSCGHKENLFFLEPGRSSGIGAGKLWMELDDVEIASTMHSTILSSMYSLGGQDDGRPRSYSSGSGSGRSSVRSRHYYNPPPSQVGMGKLPVTTASAAPATLPKHVRTRCESFPATHVTGISDEARYRTSSEGEQSMKRPRPLHMLRRKAGSMSPGTRVRVWSHGKPLPHFHSLLHSRTNSLPGSYTSSSNSSIEHLNVNQEGYVQPGNGQSPAMSDSNHSSDEFSGSPLPDLSTHQHMQHFMATLGSRSTTPPPSRTPPLYDLHHRASLQFYSSPMDYPRAPPPPSNPPEVNPLLPQATTSPTSQHEYVNVPSVHSRSHSMDDNLSCGTGASSLSTSPQISGYLQSVSMSPDVGYGQSPSQSSSHSHYGDYNIMYTPTSTSPGGLDNDEYTPMSYGGSDMYPHETSEQISSDYTLMTPSLSGSGSTPAEDKSGYVPMKPMIRSLPQDINSGRRRSLSDNRLVDGSYSPSCPLSRSPDKPPRAASGKTSLPHSYPSSSTATTVTAKHPTIPLVSCHGLRVELHNDMSQDASRPITSSTESKPATTKSHASDDYACMNGVARNSSQKGRSPLPESSTSGDVDHEYLHMSPMSMSARKSVVGAVLCVAESQSPVGGTPNPQYPHQRAVAKVGLTYSTNSLDRPSNKPRSRAASLFSTRSSRHGKKQSQRLNSDSRSSASSTTDSSSSQALGGEYVSINFDRARKQVGPAYLSLTETAPGPSGEPESSTESQAANHPSPRTPKAIHDSNRNLVSKSPLGDDYTFIKPGEANGGS